MPHLAKIAYAAVFTIVSLSATAHHRAEQPDSLTAPFSSRQAVEAYLRTAKVVEEKRTPEGITDPLRLTLYDGRVRHDADFKDIDVRKMGITKLEFGAEYDFKDSWKFEVAAYELDKLLSLNMVPVTVERTHKGKRGSLQFWVEGELERDRLKRNEKPPIAWKWNFQMYKVWIFDKLIFNIDRNVGNLLVTPDWKCVMIDHSRCFKCLGDVKGIKDLQIFSRSLMKALKELDEDTVKEKCSEWLTPPEISLMMQRRDQIVKHYEKLLKKEGNKITYQ
jgi:hypothetical protein